MVYGRGHLHPEAEPGVLGPTAPVVRAATKKLPRGGWSAKLIGGLGRINRIGGAPHRVHGQPRRKAWTLARSWAPTMSMSLLDHACSARAFSSAKSYLM